MRKALYILGALNDSDIEWLARYGERMVCPRDSFLIRQGEAIEYLYVLIDGQLSVRIGNNAEKEIALLLPGEIVGEISFVDHRKPTASVAALQESKVLALSKTVLTAKLERDPGFAARFYRAIASFLADRLYVTTSRLGYGSDRPDVDSDEIDESAMEDISLAAVRIDKLLRYLAGEQDIGSFAATKL